LPVLDDRREEALVVIFQIVGNGHEKGFIINEKKCPATKRVKKPVLSSEPAFKNSSLVSS
jgi:hypothetical protein